MTTTQMSIKDEVRISKSEAKKELWRRGEISWKLKSHQKSLYDLFYNTEHKTQTWLLARRSGKSYTLTLLAIEACIRKPNTIVKFLSPTRLQMQSNIRPLIRQILEDCPEEIKPEFKAKDYVYYFPNGSEIQLAGSESGHAQKLRGGYSHIAIVDEAQDVTDLSDVVKSVLLPTTLTTRGKVLLAGTPPKNPDHDFVRFIEEADLRGSLVKKVVDDNVLLTRDDIDKLIEELGGINSEECRRELYCEIIKDPTYSAIPEFTVELEKEIIKEWPKPPHFDSYEGMDLGFKDLTAVIFAYYDFRADKVIVDDELVVKGQDLQLPTLIASIQKKEVDLWMNPLTNEVIYPTIRVSDINYIVTNEIARASKGAVTFLPAKKDDKEAAVNKLRVLIQNKKIIINPRCQVLIRHLRNVRWDKSKSAHSQFARSPDDGHYDAVDALIYLVRHIQYGKNPYPFGYNTDLRRQDMFLPNPEKFGPQAGAADVYRKIFNIKPRRK